MQYSVSDTIRIHDIMRVPVLPLRKMVLFPKSIVTVCVARDTSRKVVEHAQTHNLPIILVAQKSPFQEEPGINDLYRVGTICKIIQVVQFADGSLQVTVEAEERIVIEEYESIEPFFEAKFSILADKDEDGVEHEALFRTLMKSFESYVKHMQIFSVDLINTISDLGDISKSANLIVGYLAIKVDEKQKILEETSVNNKLKKLIELIELELQILTLEKSIKEQVEKNQKQYFLQEQAKIIQQELNNGEEDPVDILAHKIKKSRMSNEAKEKATSELKKLRFMNSVSGEASIVKSYIECLLDLPWRKFAKVNEDFKKAKDILDEEHYGLDKVKERIYELISVQMRVKKTKSSILCLVGPPGVGKTSIVKSIAKAMDRPFVRISLGGLHDEAEIRGHRKTYIGAMPGKIIQAMKKAKVSNPVVLLDEIGKIGYDVKGDPAAALLEVLDPEQNTTFQDNYLEVGYDLSNVLFVATTNTLNLPPALVDRLEIMRISGYTEKEKVQIAEKYLISKQMELHGLKNEELVFASGVIEEIIRKYTREAGVRNLEREIANIVRKTVKLIVESEIRTKNISKEDKGAAQLDGTSQVATSSGEVQKLDKSGVLSKIEVNSENLKTFLGTERFSDDAAELIDRVGVCTGLAWTEVGGDILYIESAIFPGTGKITSTGHLGEVMKESVNAAMTVVKSKYEKYGLDPEVFKKYDVHLHVPEAAIPKDGPSAGITICCAIISSFLKKKLRGNLAMTGEISLRGLVLPIGGVKEKVLAAHRFGIKNIILPAKNMKDLEDVPAYVKDELNISFCDTIDQVFDMAITDNE
ncbi:MAG: endopeptidase La [Alphaproteobacteria bacterium]|nr:MAG: endopeptidase La [Alphaproteobacteria bacterium]